MIKKYNKEIKKAILIRQVENNLLELFNQGLLNGTVHTCIGQEFNGVFISKYLNVNDHVITNHRGHGHYLSKFNDIEGLISELMGKVTGCSKGIGGSQHLFNKNFLSNGIQGGMLPIATGIGYFYKKNKINNISVAYIGDGTLGEGIVYETFNLASKLEVPLLIVIENNGISQSTKKDQVFAGNIKSRCEGFNIKHLIVNSSDIENLDLFCENAIQYVRTQNKPLVLEIISYRLKSHSKGDDNRSDTEIKQLENDDVLNNILCLDEFKDYENQIDSEIKRIINKIKAQETTELINELSLINIYEDNKKNILNENARYGELINKALREFLEYSSNNIIIGEDIQDNNEYNPKSYGGAFKITKGLSIDFPNQVINSAISEAAITGFSTGYTIAGGKSITEIMFGDFSTLIFDQILQHSSKFELMYGGQIKCPSIIRTPMGGKRGYGPTHSQSLEKHFLGIPNLNVIALNHRISPIDVYKNITLKLNSPTLIIENKILYTVNANTSKALGYKYEINNRLFPEILITPKNKKPKITVICYGGNLIEVEEILTDLIIEKELFIDVICPCILSEIDISSIIESINTTGTILIIEEGSNYASWSSEIISQISEVYNKPLNISRLGNNNIVPSSFLAELNTLPNKKSIKKSLYNLL